MVRQLLVAVMALASCSPTAQRAPAPAPSASPAAAAIPASLQGRYALHAAACDAGPAASPAAVRDLLTIGGGAIAFGVTPQPVDSIAIRADRVVIDTTVTGSDGTEEARRYTFRTAHDGERLTRTELNRPDQVYTRCPNRPS